MWIKILQFIVSLSLLVIIHELGHFLFARLFKCRVEKFYLFFNPWFSLLKFRKGETEYGVGWVPLGGYVKIAGMIDESMDTEQMKQPVQPWEFRAKPAWQRLLIMIGGVTMNVVLAAAIYIGISYAYGDAYIASKDVKYGYEFSELAREIGFRNGDKILNVNGEEIEDSKNILLAIALDQPEYVEVEREGQVVRIPVGTEYTSRILKDKYFLTPHIPKVVEETVPEGGAALAGLEKGDVLLKVNGQEVTAMVDVPQMLAGHEGRTVTMELSRMIHGTPHLITREVGVSDEGLVGIFFKHPGELLEISTRKYNFFQAIPAGFRRAYSEIGMYLKQLKLIFSPKTEAYKSVGGFIAIGNIFPDTWSWYSFWSITALLSIMLAVMNLLPIPALDGGHVMFLLYEVVTRRKPSDKFMERAQLVGFFLLMALILYANGNDIVRLFTK